MNRMDIQTVDDLVAVMDEEAEKWGRLDHDNTAVNGAGIREQWAGRGGRAYPDIPMCVYGMIHDDSEYERPDGTIANGCFQLIGFYFDDDGDRVERPAAQLAALKEEQENGKT